MSGFVRNFLLLCAFAGFFSASRLAAAPPNLNRFNPAAIAPGKTTIIGLSGENLGGVVDLWTSFPCEIAPITSSSINIQITLPATPTLGIGAVRLVTTNGLSDLHLLLIDALPMFSSWQTNRTPASAQPLQRGSAIEGTCEDLHSDFFRISAMKGERIAIEAVAQRIGSQLDPFLRLFDNKGREIAFNDDAPGLNGDAMLDVRCPASGDYLIELRDSRHGGGIRHGYQLRFSEPLPTPIPFLATEEVTRFTRPLSPASMVTRSDSKASKGQPQQLALPAEIRGTFNKPGERAVFEFHARKGEQIVFRGATRSLGSPCDLYLALQFTNGTGIAEANATSADDGSITNRITSDGAYRLVLEELTGASGPSLTYMIFAHELKPGFALTTETDRVSGPAGETLTIEVKAERRDYEGPIELSIEGLPSTFSLTNNVIPGKTNSTTLRIVAPADAQLGEYFTFSIQGREAGNETPAKERVSTLPALRAAWPALRHPPRPLDGLLALSISESKSTNPKPSQKKRKK